MLIGTALGSLDLDGPRGVHPLIGVAHADVAQELGVFYAAAWGEFPATARNRRSRDKDKTPIIEPSLQRAVNI